MKRQSYDEVLNNLLDNCEEEVLNEQEIDEIQKGLEDIKKGRVYSIESVARELGIALK
jgi:predicted transcriptional regulator